MDLEETLAKVVELGQEELRIVRKRAREKTAARDHGQDFHGDAPCRRPLDHHAHLLRRLHDGEFSQHWHQTSRRMCAGAVWTANRSHQGDLTGISWVHGSLAGEDRQCSGQRRLTGDWIMAR